MEIVLNEREWIENMVSGHQLGRHPYIVIRRYAIYLRSQGYKTKDVRRMLEDYVLRCDPNANKLRWTEMIERAVKESDGRKLIEIDGVHITSAEMEEIKSLVGITRQKIMFTLLCLAKFRHLAMDGNDYWVSYNTSDIFSLANVSISHKYSMMILHELCNAGMLGYNRIVDSVSMRVNIVHNDSEPVLFVSDFRNLGYQYLRSIDGSGYTECDECGLVIPKKCNRQKYCKACARRVNIEKTSQRTHEIKADIVA